MPEDGGSPTEKNAADEPLVPRKENPITSEGNSGSESKDGNPRPHWADRIIAIFTGLIFLTYIGSNYFACRQMRLTKAAIDQSATNNAAAILAQQQIAQQSLSVSQENFRKSLDTTTEQLRLDQRAWLGVDGVSGEPKEKERWEITVAIKNTGKTPAKDVGFLASLHVIDKGEALTFDYSSV